MKHYRINKVAENGGRVLKKKDILAPNDAAAMRRAGDDDDCPVCEVYESGELIGKIED